MLAQAERNEMQRAARRPVTLARLLRSIKQHTHTSYIIGIKQQFFVVFLNNMLDGESRTTDSTITKECGFESRLSFSS
mgnify:CR=1 FL=1